MRLALIAGFCLLLSPLYADSVDDLVRSEMQRHPIPGMALEIIQDGKAIKRAAYGFANLEWHTPTTTETVFEIGSVTKQFTAAGILMLQQEGKLSVDDRLAAHVPGTPEIWKDITLRNLLTHTSGIKNYTALAGFELSKHLTQAQFVQLLAAQPLDFAPGDGWRYSNSGFNLLGYVIENVSGMNYWQFMKERVFGPLEMTSTTNRDPRELIQFRASGYETNTSGGYINRDYDLTDLFAAGAIVSTIDDMTKWNASLDSHQLLTEASEEEMWTPLKLNSGKTRDYGFGWFLDPWHGRQNIGHSGSTSGFSATIQRFPGEKLTIIVLTNADELNVATVVARDIALLYFTPATR